MNDRADALETAEAILRSRNPTDSERAAKYGSRWWLITLAEFKKPLDKDHKTYLFASHVEVTSHGDLIMWGKADDELFILDTVAAGAWVRVQAVSVLDGFPVSQMPG